MTSLDERLLPAGTEDSAAVTVSVVSGTASCSKSKQLDEDEKLPSHSVEVAQPDAVAIATPRILTLALLVVVFTHVERLYISSPFIGEQYYAIGWTYIWILMVNGWPFYLLFMFFGYFAFSEIRATPNGKYVEEKTKRLGIPFLFGILVLVPSYLAGEYILDGITPSFVEVMIAYLNIYPTCFIKPEQCLVELLFDNFWFLAALFFFLILLLPIVRCLQTSNVRLARFQNPSPTTSYIVSTILLYGVVPTVTFAFHVGLLSIPNAYFYVSRNNVLGGLVYLILGTALAWSRALFNAVVYLRWYSLSLTLVFVYMLVNVDLAVQTDISSHPVWFLALKSFSAAANASCVWGFAIANLAFLHPFVALLWDYLAQAAIPIYCLHVFVARYVALALLYAMANAYPIVDSFLHFLIHYILTILVAVALYESLFRFRFTRPLVGGLNAPRSALPAAKVPPSSPPPISDKEEKTDPVATATTTAGNKEPVRARLRRQFAAGASYVSSKFKRPPAPAAGMEQSVPGTA